MSFNDEKHSKIIAVIKICVLLFIILAIPLYIYFCHHEIIETFSDVRRVETFVLNHKGSNILILMACQIVQIMICVIPGQPIQFACGYLFSPILALLISIAGATIGATITFFLAKLLGRDAMRMFFGEKKGVQYIDKLNTRNGYFLLFALCVIPGFPKDAMCYLAGLSKIRYLPFIIIITVARIPGMLGSILIGHFSYSQDYILIAVVAVVVIILTILGARHKDKILEWGDRTYDKLNNLYKK